MQEPSVIEVNLPAISRNMRVLRRVVGTEVKLCPIVKADGYGLGAARTSRTLVAAGADMLAVYTPAQAVELFNAAVGVPVLVLIPVREVQRVDEFYRGFIREQLHLTVHDEDQLDELIRLAERFGAAIPLHLEVDTGMSRGGCLLADAPRLLERIASHPRLRLAGLLTHFANAESDAALTESQEARFREVIQQHEHLIPADCLIHAANTFATFRGERFHHRMVRFGLAWAGYCREEMDEADILEGACDLEPAITWSSRIVQIKRVPARTAVGYGSKWRAKKASVIGLVPVGYADGYPVTAGSIDQPSGSRRSGSAKGGKRSAAGDDRGYVSIVMEFSGERIVEHAPVVGAVNMDQITIDLTPAIEALHAEARGDLIHVGTRVELISSDPDAPNHLPTLAARCGTFAHEMICRLNPRLRREYKMHRAGEIPPARATAMAG